MNVKKTKAMVLSKESNGKKVNIKVNNEILEQMDTFKYLGTQIKDVLRTDTELETRGNFAKSKFSSMHNVLTSKTPKMSTRIIITSAAIYASSHQPLDGVDCT